MDFVVGKDDAAVLGALDDSGLEEGCDIAVNRFHVAPDPPTDVAGRQRTRPGHRTQQA